MARARLVGINHVAIEVGDLDAALDLYARVFAFELRGRRPTMAWIDMGDQFLAVSQGRTQGPDVHRHFGLVVDDLGAAQAAAEEAGLTVRASGRGGIDFRDPWGNLFQCVDYREIQFERTPGVRRALGIEALAKSASAQQEIAERGFAG